MIVSLIARIGCLLIGHACPSNCLLIGNRKVCQCHEPCPACGWRPKRSGGIPVGERTTGKPARKADAR